MKRKKIELGKRFNPLTLEIGSGNFRYLPCGTCDEQNGDVISDEYRSTLPDKWMTIEELGLKRRCGL